MGLHARARIRISVVWDAHVFLADSLSVVGKSSIPCLRAEIKRLRLMTAPISLLSYFLCIVEAARRLVWRGIKMSACTAGDGNGGAIELAVDSRRFVVAFRAA